MDLDAARKLCAQFGIYQSLPPLGPLETCSMRTIARLLQKYGEPAMILTLRVFTETHPANTSELNRETITAVNAICRSQRKWVALGLAFLEAFDAIDLGALRAEVHRLNIWTCKIHETMAALLIGRLHPVLDPLLPKPPPKPVKVKAVPKLPRSVTRIPEIEKNIGLGVALLALRAAVPGNAPFGRHARKRFPDVDQRQASQTMRVARIYAGRPEIWRAASWRTLLELSSPKMSPAVRQAFEAKVLAGETITAPQIRRARGPLKGGSPKRRPADQPTPRMAA